MNSSPSKLLVAGTLLLLVSIAAHSTSAFAPAPTADFVQPRSYSCSSSLTRSTDGAALLPIHKPIGVAPSRQAASTSSSPSSLQMISISAIGTALADFYKGWPLLAGFTTASAKGAAADRLAQWRDVCTTKFSIRRNLAMVLYSGTVLGVSCEIMYNRLFPMLFGGEKTLARVVKMTLFDGLINAPLLWLPPAYLVQALIYGYPKRKALQKYVQDVRENGLLFKYWSLWMPVSFLNFSVVPPHYRIVFVASVSFFWMTILSVLANKSDQDPESCPVEPEPVLQNPRALD